MQIRSVISGSCCLAVFAIGAMAYAASLSKTDKDFMITAAKANMTEAHEGQMAEDQGTAADVKDYGKTLAQDHTQAYDELSQLATKLGVDIPKGIDTAKDRTIEQMAHLKGANFDRTFARDEVTAHKEAIALFKREAEHGEDADVKAYASKMVPVLEKHLQLAEQCAKAPKHT